LFHHKKGDKMPITDEATDAAFETFGEEATYAAPGDDPQAVILLRDRFNPDFAYHDTHFAHDPAEILFALVRVSDVATPEDGDALDVQGVVFTQVGAAIFRTPGLWRLTLRRME
jgi:hypothetical protein